MATLKRWNGTEWRPVGEDSYAPIGQSHIFVDTDGVPYFNAAAPGGVVVLSDTDGVPYLPSIGA